MRTPTEWAEHAVQEYRRITSDYPDVAHAADLVALTVITSHCGDHFTDGEIAAMVRAITAAYTADTTPPLECAEPHASP